MHKNSPTAVSTGPRALAHAGLSRCCSARRLASHDGRSRLARRLHRGVTSGVVICHLNVVDVEAEIRLEGRAAHRALVEREVVEAVVADTQVAAWQQNGVLGPGWSKGSVIGDFGGALERLQGCTAGPKRGPRAALES